MLLPGYFTQFITLIPYIALMAKPESLPHHLPHPQYRPDIDGLRAVAVLSVVFFHAFPEVLKGGFIGVDIFFVISGYLISSILFGSLKRGTFSFREFYTRRILRIFPALVVVLAVCWFIGWLALLPDEFRQLGKHMAGGAGFVSNLLFWQEAGYFDTSAETKPLLHLWSLGVEEQFYIIWPCLLLLAWKRRIDALKMAVCIIAGSFAVNVYTVQTDAVQAFYSPLSRFWELVAGGSLAYLKQHMIPVGQRVGLGLSSLFGLFTARRPPVVSPILLHNCLAVLGLLLISGAAIFIDRKMLFPGFWAILPTLGACLIIAAGPLALVNRLLLSSRPMVAVGLISYPLYLWHWPLLSFAAIMETGTPAYGVRITAVVLAVVLAWLTYACIERPIRFGRFWGAGQFEWPRLFGMNARVPALAVAMVFIAILGGVAYFKGNVRSTTLTADIAEQTRKLDFALHFAKWSPCPGEADTWNCKILDPKKPPEIALIGDSHSVHLASGLAEVETIVEQNIKSRNGDGCFPVFEVERNGKRYYACEGDIIRKGIEEAIQSESVKVIMLSGYAVWKIRPFDDNLHLEEVSGEEVSENAAILEEALHKTLARLVASGKKIVFFVDTPVLDFEPTECVPVRPVYLKGHLLKDPCALSRPLFDRRNAEYHQIVASAQQAFPTVKFINLYNYLCDQEYCYALREDVLLYRDHSHLSADGSRYLFGKMADELAGLGREKQELGISYNRPL